MPVNVSRDTVSLTPDFPWHLVGNLWHWLNSPRSASLDDYAPKTTSDFDVTFLQRRRWERTWTVRDNDKAVGYLGFAPHNPVTGQFHGLVIDPEARGRGLGIQAMRLAIEELRGEGFRTFTSMPFADNLKALALLGQIGFRTAGYMKHGTERDGQPCGVVMLVLEVE